MATEIKVKTVRDGLLLKGYLTGQVKGVSHVTKELKDNSDETKVAKGEVDRQVRRGMERFGKTVAEKIAEKDAKRAITKIEESKTEQDAEKVERMIKGAQGTMRRLDYMSTKDGDMFSKLAAKIRKALPATIKVSKNVAKGESALRITGSRKDKRERKPRNGSKASKVTLKASGKAIKAPKSKVTASIRSKSLETQATV